MTAVAMLLGLVFGAWVGFLAGWRARTWPMRGDSVARLHHAAALDAEDARPIRKGAHR